MNWKEKSNLYIVATLVATATIAVFAAASLLVWHAVYRLTGFIFCPLDELVECIKTVCIVAFVTLLAPLASVAGICLWLHHKEQKTDDSHIDTKGGQ